MIKKTKQISAVLDTNIIISGFISPKGNPAKVLNEFIKGSFLLVTSKELIDELKDVFTRPGIKNKYHLDIQDIDEFLISLQELAKIVPVKIRVTVSRDPKDDMFLSCALEGKADCLVTGDNDLLVLKEFGGAKIITIREFLDVLKEKLNPNEK